MPLTLCRQPRAARSRRDHPSRMPRPVYLDYHATTPVDPAGARGDAAVLHGAVRQPGEPAARLRLGRARRPSTRARAQVAALIGASRERDRLHERRDANRTTWRSRAVACSHRERGNHLITVGDRAQVGARLVQAPRARGLARHVARRRLAAGSSISTSFARAITDETDPRVASWRPTTRSASSSRSPRSARSRRSAACCSTPTPRRRSARSRSTSGAMGIDLLSLTGAQVLRPEGGGRAVRAAAEAAAASSPARSTAAGTRTACAPARSTCPGIVGLGRARRSAAR